MTRETRIVAIDAGEPEGSAVAEGPAEQAEMTVPVAEAAEPEIPARSWPVVAGAGLTVAALAGWTALFVAANLAAMQAGATLQQWSGWLRDWAVPVLLIAMVWVIAMRNSRREAHRFGATARMLSSESQRLETRLITVNRELSLAREFIAAQARDMESLGRVATERLSQHAERLATLVGDNGNRLDTIQTVSAAALENMEALRSHLPVIASSAKDVTNNIGTAGNTAKTQIEELIGGFTRLNQFGQVSERQVQAMRDTVERTLADLDRQTDRIGETVDERFAALTDRGMEFQAQLQSHEVEALAAIRRRATVLSDELEEARKILDVQESESLTSLRARLGTIRDESGALVRSLREGEATVLQSWKIAIVQLEEDLSVAIAKVAEIDEQALATARKRLAELESEAADIDSRMSERDRAFTEAVETRRSTFEESHTQFVTRLSDQFDGLDSRIAERRSAQEELGEKLVAHGETIAARFDEFAQKLDEVARLGDNAEGKVAQSLVALGEKLGASRDALNGTGVVISQLTDGSVRLLELIQASVQHSTTDLPQAMAVSEGKLVDIENRVEALKQGLGDAETRGLRVSGHIAQGTEAIDQAISRIETLTGNVAQSGAQQAATLDAMAASLEKVRSESQALAEQAQAELKRAIEELDQSAHAAVAGIGALSAEAITDLANRLSAESTAAIDTAMRARGEEVVGQLELAAVGAAGVSREAAIQLRDQLAKVSELTAHLEQRVAQARARAEEQVDNDFARRIALITESLNSNAIDIARAMASDVTDTAWSAYLKGDRGIFTRRAVRLLDSGESKAIAALYEEDRNFHDHVSRYIHDFEAMLRQLLSTRDGHALGVTVLSSDMGKLYVALAQGIERLRN